MADRTWNAVDARLYEEIWSKEAKLILGVLIARCPNQYGVYEVPYLILSTLFGSSDVEQGMNELSSMDEPPIILYRDKRVVWIIKKWKRSAHNINNQRGAYNLLTQHYPEVWGDFFNAYKASLIGLTPDERGMDHGSPSDEPSESESESDTEKKTKKKKETTPPDGGQFNLVGFWIDVYRREIDPDYYKTTKFPGRAASALKRALKSVKGDTKEYCSRVLNFATDPWVKEHKADPDYFVRYMDKYREPVERKRVVYE